MGNCANREKTSVNALIEHQILRPFIESLEITRRGLAELVESTDCLVEGLPSPDCFVNLCKKLGVNYSRYKHLFKYFTKKELVNVRKLKCLWILLGNEDKQGKIKVLFDNYKDESGALLAKGAEIMFGDIVKIHCRYLPSYFMKALKNQDLEIYVEKLEKIPVGLENYLKNLLMVRDSEISFEKFSQLMGSKNLEYTLDPFRFRIKALKIMENVLGPANSVMRYLAESSSHKKWVVKDLKISSGNNNDKYLKKCNTTIIPISNNTQNVVVIKPSPKIFKFRTIDCSTLPLTTNKKKIKFEEN